MTRPICPDPRCQKPLANDEDMDAPDTDTAMLCWIEYNSLAHDNLPRWSAYWRDHAASLNATIARLGAVARAAEWCAFQDNTQSDVIALDNALAALTPEDKRRAGIAL